MIYAELFKSKGTGLWHVCTLNNRLWSGVSPWFKRKQDARQWATENSFKISE